jgi:sulfonate transport system ATP-binding protein
VSETCHKTQTLNINNVAKSFNIHGANLDVLEDIKLTVADNEFLTIVGSSGCGKSTLLRIIAGLEFASSGYVEYGGNKITKPSVKIGMIFQDPRLFPWLTAKDNIAFGIHGKISKTDRTELVDRYVKLVGLEGFEKAHPKQLSGGMQQRVSMARPLIANPHLLLLDEPFGALDAFTRINLQNEILKIREHEKRMMILVTHDIDEAIFLSDRIVVMSKAPGKIKKLIPVGLARPRDRNSYDFMKIRREIYEHFFEGVTAGIDYYI